MRVRVRRRRLDGVRRVPRQRGRATARPRRGVRGGAGGGAADAPRPEADYAAAVACSPQAGAGQGRRAARTVQVQVQVRKSIDHANHVMSGSEKLS